ncbi:MAG: nucleotidyl transferase AbiEii/AbiGii toxin family protein [Lachnospiraceae bacterium]|nr:nucleotidyl transferase AbiEii/AbiGii toxin family protein [Lachnospiraceae bacterium]
MGYLHKDKEQFREAIDLTAYQTNIMAQAVEKDYYVTLILRLLAEKVPFVVFKGGTSLSKCHQVIRRFSEDIDITIDTTLSQGQKKKLKEAISGIADELGMKILNLDETRSRRDYNRYIISYDTVLPTHDRTLQTAVLIETSFTTISFPTVIMAVHNYIGEMMSTEAPGMMDEYLLSPFEMKVQGIDRTLTDKIFAICDYYMQSKVKKHSRHLYDIYKLLPLVPQDDDFHQLVLEVRAVRAKSVICPSAQPNVDIPSLLKEIIQKEVYRIDYEDLTSRLLEENIDYGTVIEAVAVIAENHMFEK